MNLTSIGTSFIGGFVFTVGAITAVIVMKLLFHVGLC